MKEYKIENFTFCYPDSFEKIMDLGLCNFDIWFIMDSAQATSIYNGMKKRYPNRSLIPFAKRVDSDDTACFEIEKGTKIQIIHDFADEGYEQREEYNDFWEWFNNAIKEMIEYNRSEEIE